MRALITLLMLLAIVAPAAAEDGKGDAVQAEQLDRLFGKLRDTEGGAAILSAESQIWSLWMQAGTAEQNEILVTATNAMNNGSFRLSEEILNRLLTQTTTFAEAYNKRATLYFLMGRYEESLTDIEKTLELEPRHFGALSGRGMIYQRLGKTREAVRAYEDALAVNPYLPGARLAIKQLQNLAPNL